jgi:SM-20-related protein
MPIQPQPVDQLAIETAAARIAAEVAEKGWSVTHGYVNPKMVASLRQRVRDWWEEGDLRRAGIGRGDNFQLRDDIRSDYVRWLDLESAGRFHDLLVEHYEPLRLAFNRELYLGLFEFEGHATVYPPGSFYARHVDRFTTAAHRKLSAVLYLNDDWQAADGGQLRMYFTHDDGIETSHDVLPEGGTLVTFLSDRIPHEVLPAHRERLSLTGWFRARD